MRPIAAEYNIFDICYELDLKPDTEITILDEVDIPINGNFCKIDSVLTAEPNQLVSFIGIISSLEPLIEDTSADGRDVSILKVNVRDDDSNEVSF